MIRTFEAQALIKTLHLYSAQRFHSLWWNNAIESVRRAKQTLRKTQMYLPRKFCEAQPEGMLLPKTCFPPLSPFFQHNEVPSEHRLQTRYSGKYAHTEGAHRSIHLQCWTTLSGCSRGEPETHGGMSLNDCLQGDMKPETSQAEMQVEHVENRWAGCKIFQVCIHATNTQRRQHSAFNTTPLKKKYIKNLLQHSGKTD